MPHQERKIQKGNMRQLEYNQFKVNLTHEESNKLKGNIVPTRVKSI